MSGKKIIFKSPEEKDAIVEQWIFDTETQKHGKKEEQIYASAETRDHVFKENRKDGNAESQKKDNIYEQKEDMKRLTVDLPSTLHKAFKCAAVINDTTMVDLACRLIEEYVRQNKN